MIDKINHKIKKHTFRIMQFGVIILFFIALIFFSSKQINSFHNNELTSNSRYHPSETPTDWMAMQRCYPYPEIKLKSYLFGLEQARKLHQKSNTTKFSWQASGPDNIGGRITDIAIHPSSLSTIYIGSASGGIYKTTNSGLSWANIFSDAPSIAIGDLAIDPANPSIIYAGTGEANASSYSFLGNGLYKTLDAGATWNHIGLDSSGYIGRIIVDSGNSNRIFVAACGTLFSPNQQRGIFRSDDGGVSWTRKLFVNDSTSAIDIVQNPNNPNILYAAMWQRSRGLNYRRSFGDGSGIYYSTNGGDNWIELTSGLPSGTGVGRIGLAMAKSNPFVIYAFYDNASGVEVYKTLNGGSSWFKVNDAPLQGMNSNFGWYFGQIRVDPANEDRVFVMGVTLYRSNDGGSSWTGVNSGIHVDHHAMYIDLNTGLVYEGNDGGLYFSNDYGDSWTKINNLSITQFYAIDIDNTFPFRIYGGTQDNGTVRTLNGTIGNWQHILGGDGMYCLVDYTDPDRIYAETQWGSLYRSLDGGNSFSWIASQFYGDRKNWMSPYVMDPVNPDILYFGTYRIWKTIDGGDQWIAVSGDLTKGGDGSTFHTITTIDVSRIDPDIVIAGTDDGRAHISTNGGATWTSVHSGLPDRWITRVATDPFSDSIVYATVSGFRWDEPLSHVFRSTNLGQSWTDISMGLPEIPINCIVLDPLIQNRIYVGSDAGVFYTDNGGQGWAGLSQGIPNVAVISLKIHNASRKLVAGTYGCSTYSLTLDSIAGNLSIAGTIRYSNSAATALNNTNVILIDSSLNIVDSTRTNYNGYYSFFNISGGTYHLKATSGNDWGGSNSTDALLAMYHFVGIDTLTGLFLDAADTDGSGVVNSADALMIQKRFVTMIDSFPVGDWLYEKPIVSVSSSTAAIVNFSGLCYGDPNASYIPSISKQADIKIDKSGDIEVNENEAIFLPILSNYKMEVGALSLVLHYNKQNFDILDVIPNIAATNFIYNILENEVRISWYNYPAGLINANDTLFRLILKQNNSHTNSSFTIEAQGEFCDKDGAVLSDVSLYYPEINTFDAREAYSIQVYPNPFVNYTNIKLILLQDEQVSIKVFDGNGRFVFEYYNGFLNKDIHFFRWNGTDLHNHKLTKGQYFIVIETSQKTESQRILLL